MNETLEQTSACEDTPIGLENEAKEIVRKNMYWAMGLSVVPVPIFDMVAVSGFQARSLNELSGLYNVSFKSNLVKNICATLISGLGSTYFGSMLAGSVFKFVPAVGPLLSAASTPIMAGALTYATGIVFIQHFESGGTFLDFDPKAVREFFREKFNEGLDVATKEMAGSGKKTAAAK